MSTKYYFKKYQFPILFLLLAFNTILTNAQITLPAIVSSNMVLQRNSTITLWGWASPSEKISIKTSWIRKEINLTANADGTLQVEVATTNSKEQHSINLKNKKSNILLENILFGEVWLCYGQSNMEMPLKGFACQPAFGAA